MFTARYGLSPYITQIRFVLKELVLQRFYLTTEAFPLVFVNNISVCIHIREARFSAFGLGISFQDRRSRVRYPMVSLEFFNDLIILTALWPWGRLSL